MNRTVRVDNRAIVTAVVRLLLEGTDLIAFKYDSGFTVDFQRPVEDAAKLGMPAEVSLVLRAQWWPGTTNEVPREFATEGTHPRHCRPEQPYQAFKLMSFVGRSVHRAEVGVDGSLELALSHGDVIRVSGKEEEWDFCWHLFVPSAIPGVDAWSITSDGEGNIEGSWPDNAPIPAL